MDEQDWIDELVDAQLANRGAARGWIDRCPHKCGSEWHGFAYPQCPGSHVALPQTPSVSQPKPEWPVS